MQENIALVTKLGQLYARQQELLSIITKLHDEAFQVNVQYVLVEKRVEMLVK